MSEIKPDSLRKKMDQLRNAYRFEGMISTSQLAKRLGLHAITTRRWCTIHGLQYVRVGDTTMLMVYPQMVQTWLEARPWMQQINRSHEPVKFLAKDWKEQLYRSEKCPAPNQPTSPNPSKPCQDAAGASAATSSR